MNVINKGLKILLVLMFLGATGKLFSEEFQNKESFEDYEAQVSLFAPESDRSLAYPIKYVLFYQSIGLVVLTSLDEDITEFDEFSLDNFLDGFTEVPGRDGDGAFFNYLLHPLWGSETYLRARSQNFNWWESFLFSTASSIVWEFGMENFVEQPSRDDLLITSTFGSLLGEFRFRTKKKLLQSETRLSKVLTILIDPIQSTTVGIGKLFGQDWTEPAYHDGGSKGSRVNFDLAPTITPKGHLGIELLYAYQF